MGNTLSYCILNGSLNTTAKHDGSPLHKCKAAHSYLSVLWYSCKDQECQFIRNVTIMNMVL